MAIADFFNEHGNNEGYDFAGGLEFPEAENTETVITTEMLERAEAFAGIDDHRFNPKMLYKKLCGSMSI